MAFRRIAIADRRIQLVSLIDLIFILLIFFIIASLLIKLTDGEAKLYIPTPKNEPGEAQILIQILDEDSYLWLDHTAIDTLNTYSYRQRAPIAPAAKVDLLLQHLTLDANGITSRLASLIAEAQEKPNEDYFVVIRCPDDQPYFYATNIIEKLVDVPSFEYGCVSGTVADLRNSANFSVKGNVLQIDFAQP